MPKFAVVEFLEEQTVECIPLLWIAEDKSCAFWPGFVSRMKLRKAVKLEIPPEPKWKSFAIKIMAYAGVYVFY